MQARIPNRHDSSTEEFGPFEAESISRQGNVVTAEFEIPEDAAVGVALDCHVEFASQDADGGTLVFKKNDALRVTE